MVGQISRDTTSGVLASITGFEHDTADALVNMEFQIDTIPTRVYGTSDYLFEEDSTNLFYLQGPDYFSVNLHKITGRVTAYYLREMAITGEEYTIICNTILLKQ
jgi:hypothetical protein